MENEIKVNVVAKDNVTTVLVGKANTPKLPKKLVINGDFSAVSRYLDKKNTSIVLNEFQSVNEDTVVICDKENLTIKLLTNPNNEYATEVNGKAEFSNELKEFGVNQTKFFNREQLIKIFRYNRRFFPNKAENIELLAAYQNFTASVNKNIKENSDLRGNKDNQFQKRVDTSLPERFLIQIPIFKGENPVTFPVEICMEDYDSGMRFWFESVDLAELIAKKTDEIFDRELDSCKDFAIIFK